MKTMKIAFVLAALLMGALAAAPAIAGGYYNGPYRGHHGGYSGVRVGFYVGGPIGFPYYYPSYPHFSYPYPAYPYYPAPVVVQQQPTVYVERPIQQSAPAASPQQMQGYWYYCADSRMYYPYVKECASAWQRVAPQPG